MNGLDNVVRVFIYWISMMISFILIALMVYSRDIFLHFAGFGLLLMLNIYGGMALFIRDIFSTEGMNLKVDRTRRQNSDMKKKKAYKGLLYFTIALYVSIIILNAVL